MCQKHMNLIPIQGLTNYTAKSYPSTIRTYEYSRALLPNSSIKIGELSSNRDQ